MTGRGGRIQARGDNRVTDTMVDLTGRLKATVGWQPESLPTNHVPQITLSNMRHRTDSYGCNMACHMSFQNSRTLAPQLSTSFLNHVRNLQCGTMCLHHTRVLGISTHSTSRPATRLRRTFAPASPQPR
ncbi:hypothetical protein DOTSEDRAFT_48307 [Dothistroma septosporum NZE10]|uniref:Uncharacterized protein n=1 Tax=Dothistroma septosporum (strain NZE10 / CBS 128990) TaxID=675120 RepID=M2XH57_DOTSN|nr:hypothetical protein DOTSEDRAFT_48307 [Dothistroma septosporum NZE10]